MQDTGATRFLGPANRQSNANSAREATVDSSFDQIGCEKGEGIRINAVCPGTIDTPIVADMLEGQADTMAEIMKQQSIGRLGRAEECSPAASFVIGVGLPVDGGFTAH